jgi:hypothetical protein
MYFQYFTYLDWTSPRAYEYKSGIETYCVQAANYSSAGCVCVEWKEKYQIPIQSLSFYHKPI